jgi:hypothetical protein
VGNFDEKKILQLATADSIVGVSPKRFAILPETELHELSSMT